MATFQAQANKTYKRYTGTDDAGKPTYNVVRYSADDLKDPAIGQLDEQYKEDAGTDAPGAASTTPTAENPYDKARRSYYDGLDRTAPTAEEEAAIREQARKDMQNQLDAIDQAYDSILADARAKGEVDKGRNRAISARSGLLGSDFGAAHASAVESNNLKREEAVQRERALEKSKIFGKIDARTQELVKAEKEKAEKNAESYLSFLKENRDTAREDVAMLAAGGTPLSELPAEQYRQLLEQTGYDDLQLRMVYNANAPEAAKTKWESKVENGQLIVWGVDPVTGEPTMNVKQIEGVKEDGKYKPQVMPDGTLLFLPDQLDPDKTIDEQVIRYGSEGQFAKPKGGNSTTEETIKESVQEVQAQLDNFALDKAAGRSIPSWAEDLIAPERKKNADTGELEETGKYVAKTVTKGQVDTIRKSQEDSEAEEAAAQLEDVDGVAASILEDLNNDVSAYEVRQAALAAGVKESVLNEAMKKAVSEFYGS